MRTGLIPRIAVEVATIVGSILMALAVDAWWDGRREEVELRQALVGLEADMAQSRADLDFLDSLNLAIGDTAAEILGRLTGDDPASIAVPVGSLVTLVRAPTFDPPLGEVEILLQSAQLSHIRNREFRKALAAWPAAVADLDDLSQGHVAFVYDQFLPFLRETIPLGPIVETRYGPAPRESIQVPSSPELVGLLQNLRLFVMRTEAKLRSRVDPTLRGIERGLAEPS